MRILYMVARFWPYIGGVEVASARVLPELVRRGHEIMIVTSRDDHHLPEEDDFCGIPVRRLALSESLRARDPEHIVQVRGQVGALHNEFCPDLAHVLFTGPAVYYAPAASGDGACPTLLSFHGSWDLEPSGVVARTLAAADWITACSEAALGDLRAVAPSVAGRSSVILNGQEPPAHEPAELPFDPPVLLCAGRLASEKGFDLALDALASVLRVHPRARLLIAGDGPERSVLERQALSLGVSGCVEFLDWVSPASIGELIERATIVLAPSRNEGFGLVALEASLHSRPVVAACVGGLGEVVADGESGLLVAPEDPAALAAGILRLLANPDEAREMGRSGRRRAIREFSGKRHADAYEQLYERLVAGGRTVAA